MYRYIVKHPFRLQILAATFGKLRAEQKTPPAPVRHERRSGSSAVPLSFIAQMPGDVRQCRRASASPALPDALPIPLRRRAYSRRRALSVRWVYGTLSVQHAILTSINIAGIFAGVKSRRAVGEIRSSSARIPGCPRPIFSLWIRQASQSVSGWAALKWSLAAGRPRRLPNDGVGHLGLGQHRVDAGLIQRHRVKGGEHAHIGHDGQRRFPRGSRSRGTRP